MTLKTCFLAAALCIGAGAASATPIAAGRETAPGGIATAIQFGYGYGPGPGYYGPGRGYGFYGPGYGGYGRGYGAYGPGPGYRRRVVCRIRPTPYGPREVCFRR